MMKMGCNEQGHTHSEIVFTLTSFWYHDWNLCHKQWALKYHKSWCIFYISWKLCHLPHEPKELFTLQRFTGKIVIVLANVASSKTLKIEETTTFKIKINKDNNHRKLLSQSIWTRSQILSHNIKKSRNIYRARLFSITLLCKCE